ncbi:LBL_2463 family protein [Leptospira stimsonii]
MSNVLETKPDQSKEKIVVKMIFGTEHPAELKRVKSFVTKIYREAGYSDSEWKNINYDPWSTWFYVDDFGEILAAMRIIEKKPNNFIPLEVACIYDEKTYKKKGIPKRRYAVIEKNVADWNAVAFQLSQLGWRTVKILFRTVAKYCAEKGYRKVYGMYNPTLKGIEKLYLKEGSVLSKKYPGPVFFPGFNLLNEQSTFQVIELGKETLQKIASKL